ncbi:hypothetical protein ACQCWA_04475 [Rossellomorea aquimaris]|nr:hypothetical protein [Bacillus sp. CH30_1T]
MMYGLLLMATTLLIVGFVIPIAAGTTLLMAAILFGVALVLSLKKAKRS